MPRVHSVLKAMFATSLSKKRAVGLALLAVLLTLFIVFNRIPKLDTVQADLAVATSPQAQCFQGFCVESPVETSLLSRWWDFSLTYLRLISLGMVFAFLVAGITEAFLFPQGLGPGFSNRGIKGSLKGLIVGPALNLCSACIVPVAAAFRRRGAGVEATLAITQGSSTLNLPALIMAAMVFAPLIGGSRIALSLVGALLMGPLVAMAVGQGRQSLAGALPVLPETASTENEQASWRTVLIEGTWHWIRASFSYLIRLGPIMVVAGLASGLVIQWISPDTVTTWLGDDILGIAIAATVGLLINVPLLFEVPLVAALLMAGMGTAPAATLLFAAAAGGPITFWGLASVMPRRAIAAFATSTWVVGVVGGVVVLAITVLAEDREFSLRASYDVSTLSGDGALALDRGSPPRSYYDEVQASARSLERVLSSDLGETSDGLLVHSSDTLASPPQGASYTHHVTPFTNVAPWALTSGFEIWNYRPGVVVFDYDRDGDLDFYLTSEKGHANVLYRNDGDGGFRDVAREAGVETTDRNSTGVVACDIDNDGYQDLYVGSMGTLGDRLGFRSPSVEQGNQDVLFLNDGDGTFTDITSTAFGEAVNVRTGFSIGCADVDRDGWVDIFVGNLIDEDFRRFFKPYHAGQYNILYRNNGDLTFTDVTQSAGVRGPQILMRDPEGNPILYADPETGEQYEGYDPNILDALGNRTGEPTGQTHAVAFFDYDDDGDPDLWVANDGDRLHIYRNDSAPGNVRFTSVARAMGLDRVGAWMGFAFGDYDGDADLDVFITNIGFHPRLQPPPTFVGGACPYSERFLWGTCLHFLLRNDGVRSLEGLGLIGDYVDVAPNIVVEPSPIMPPASLDPANIHPMQVMPTGLAAYDFGFGATFFDYENDGDQDLYWLGSTIDRGEAPGGQIFPSAGRMLRGDGRGAFEDITVRAHLLDIMNVDYSLLDPSDPRFNRERQRIDPKFHENGKGLAHGDLDGDGYVDLIGTNSKGYMWAEEVLEPIAGPLFVWLNGGGENHWVILRLKGRMAIDGSGSNADGIGARVYVTTMPNGITEPLIQVQEVVAGSSYLSMDSLDLEFGLGDAEDIERIEVLWPSGRRQVLTDLKADRVLAIEEPEK